MEKEKAVADLIAIRKINRNIEKYVKYAHLGKYAGTVLQRTVDNFIIVLVLVY